MTKPFNTLRKKMSLPARKAAAAKTKEMLKEMPLQELRQAHQMSQERLAELCGLGLKTSWQSHIQHWLSRQCWQDGSILC